ncbi:glycosyltransferase [Flavobacterium sp.]|uniref:glycosyltransferase n=1 Tax=Flavobacterium sp. TaxID=239 RepID=UPI0028BDD5BF|nr:glycosyltransferase [Flavobacterium sp.]
MAKILFITWDGPQTSYMEGLFLPIFNQIKKTESVDFHVVQFTWAAKEKTDCIAQIAKSYGIHYSVYSITRRPVAILGSIFTLFQGVKFLQKYIDKHKIDVVMPRSTMPAVMVNRLKLPNSKILFDADGLPLEERVDFSGLSKTSKQYRWLKSEETKLLQIANGVITRSEKAIEIHLQTIGEAFKSKFSVVFNGRNIDFFQLNITQKEMMRNVLSFSQDDLVFVYCGSLGLQYGWEEMILIFKDYLQRYPKSKWLILTGNTAFAESRITSELRNSVRILSVPFEEVPKYLSVADVAFAIRKPTFSMQGVAPIKLGEYLLMGLPTIASKGIGDTEQLLDKVEGCFLFDHDEDDAASKAVSFVENYKSYSSENLRQVGITYFSLQESAVTYIKALKQL